MKPTYRFHSESGSEIEEESEGSDDSGLPRVNLCSPSKALTNVAEGMMGSLPLPSKPPPASPMASNVTAMNVLKTPDAKLRQVGYSSPFAGCSPMYQSPSPSRLLERHEKSLHQQGRLVKKVEKLTADLKARNEHEAELEELRQIGGILGLSRALSSSSSSDDDEVRAPRCSVNSRKQSSGYHESNQFPFPLFAPGYPVLVHPTRLITELYPPGYHQGEGQATPERDKMMQQDPEVLKQLICDRWFLLCYRQEPCPTSIWKWLFQIMCLSCDQYISERVYFNLRTLVDWSIDKGNVYVPSVSTVMDALVNLGGDKDLLEGGKSLGEGKDREPSPTEDSVFQTPPPAANVLINLSNLFRYISSVVTVNPTALSSEDLQQLITVLAAVSLDSSVTKDPKVLGFISQCISSLVAAISDPPWPAALTSISARMVQLSPHHHNLLHLAKLVTPSSARMTELRVAVCRASIWKLVYPDAAYRQMTDCSFAWKIVEHYYRVPAAKYDYFHMYSVVTMLGHFMNLSPMQWPSPERKTEFKTMLKKVATVKIRDIAESSERAPVKDLFISMALDMAPQRKRQTDLFSIIGN